MKTGLSSIVLTPEKKECFCGLATLDALRGIALAVMTTSEILIVDLKDWKILLRQKHRRNRDPSLVMNIFSKDDGILTSRITLI